MTIVPRDPFSEIADERRRWAPDWYTWLQEFTTEFNNTVTTVAGLVATVADKVTGPASATDNAIARFDGTTGKLLQNSSSTLSDDGLFNAIGTNSAYVARDRSVGTNNLVLYRNASIGRLLMTEAGDVLQFDIAGLAILPFGQIKFPATQNPSSNVNTLDDYEETTWTPAITFSTPGDLAITHGTQVGNATKIGRMVFASFVVDTSSFTHTTAAGPIIITGLPYSGATSGNNQTNGTLRFTGVVMAGYTDFVITSAGGASLFILASGSGVISAFVTATEVPSGGTPGFVGTIAYFTT